jgi:hypothetical protein
MGIFKPGTLNLEPLNLGNYLFTDVENGSDHFTLTKPNIKDYISDSIHKPPAMPLRIQ